MNYLHFIPLIAFALTFNGARAQKNSIKEMIKNDLDFKCLLDKDTEFEVASNIAHQCITSALEELRDRQHELDYNEERIALICKTDIHAECNQKWLDVFLSCFPEEAQEAVHQLIEIDANGTRSLCENDAENYKALLESSCSSTKKNELNYKIKECEGELAEKIKSEHFKDFFNEENCQKQKTLYDCKREAASICPDMEKALKDLVNAMQDASLCNF